MMHESQHANRINIRLVSGVVETYPLCPDGQLWDIGGAIQYVTGGRDYITLTNWQGYPVVFYKENIEKIWFSMFVPNPLH